MPRFALMIVSLLLLTAAAYAQPAPPKLEHDVHVAALGGATIKAPGWKSVRDEEAIQVLEQAPEPAKKQPFYVLMVAIEEGPAASAEIPWDKIKGNIVKAAIDKGRSLSLELGDEPWTGAAGFEARYMSGSFKGSDDEQQQVGLELIALVKDGKLLTVSLVSDAVTASTRELLAAIAASASLGG